MENNVYYIDNFYIKDFSSYDFVTMFASLMTNKNIHAFSKDTLLNYIIMCKNENKYERILKDINIKDDGNINYSDELEMIYFILKCHEILYTISSEESPILFINKDINKEEIIESKKDYEVEMQEFVKGYIYYEIGKIQDTYEKIYDEERIDLDNMSKGLKKDK